MKNKTRIRCWGAAALLAVALCLPAAAQTYSIDWYKISGGGGASSNGQYAVCGSIGQPDAGGAMSGGGYSLTGGFWSLLSVVQTPGAPLLTITYASKQAIVSWPSTVTGWTLQTNTSLALAAWGNYTGSVNSNSVTVAPQKGTLFFRLIQ